MPTDPKGSKSITDRKRTLMRRATTMASTNHSIGGVKKTAQVAMKPVSLAPIDFNPTEDDDTNVY